jgi:uncharacterized protein (DUF4415 family)
MRKRKDNDDAPEQGQEFFKRAKPGTAHMPPAMVKAIRQFRGKQKAPTKELVSIRLDRDVVDAYRRTGRGWQGRINDTLTRAAKRLS